MKTKIKSISTKAAIMAVAGVGLGMLSASAQLVDYTQGDLLLGFRATGGQGANVNLTYNVGATWDFRNNPAVGHIGNLGGALSDTYGADWFSRTDLQVGLIGVYSNTNPMHVLPHLVPDPFNGDPSATLYYSQTGNPPTMGNSASVVGAATGFVGFQTLFAAQNALAGTDGKGAAIDAGVDQSWTHYNGTFGTGAGLEHTFGSGDPMLINLYRVLATNVGADPQGTPLGGDWVTTFTIDSLGNVSAVPEPSTYALIFGAGILAFVSFRRLRARKGAAVL